MKFNQIGRQTVIVAIAILCAIAVVGFSLAATKESCLKPNAIGSVFLIGGCEVEDRPCHPDGMIAGTCFIRD